MHIEWIKKIYVYLFSLIGLVLIVIGLVQLTDLALRVWVFPQADTYVQYPVAKPVVDKNASTTYVEPTQEEQRVFEEKQMAQEHARTASTACSLLLIGIPLFWYHWRLAKKEY